MKNLNSIDSSWNGVRPRAVLAALLLLVTLMLALAASTSEAATPKIKQPSCGKLKGAKQAACKLNARVRGQIGDSHFFGTLRNGEPVDTTYCLNGATVHDRRLNPDPLGIGWKVSSAKAKDAKHFTAVLKSRVAGSKFDRSVSRQGKKWKFGSVTKRGKPRGLVPVKRTSTIVTDEAGAEKNLCDEYGAELDFPPPETDD